MESNTNVSIKAITSHLLLPNLFFCWERLRMLVVVMMVSCQELQSSLVHCLFMDNLFLKGLTGNITFNMTDKRSEYNPGVALLYRFIL